MSWVPDAGSEEEIPDKLISQEVPQVLGNNCQIDGSLLEIIRLVSYLFRERLKIGLHNVPFLNKPLSITLPVIAKAHEAHYLQHKKCLDRDNKPKKYEEEEFKELHRLVKMATNVYYAVGYVDKVLVDEAAARKAMEMIDEDAILLRCNENLHLEGKERTPKFMIFTDRRSNSIVIAIRGSTTQ